MKKFNILVSTEAHIDILDYIRNIIFNFKSPLTAEKHYKELHKAIKDLERLAPIFQLQTRQSIVEQYGMFVRRMNFKRMAILYTIEDNTVYVLRFIPQSMISGLS